MNLTHWKLERDADGIAWATLDVADSTTNTLGFAGDGRARSTS